MHLFSSILKKIFNTVFPKRCLNCQKLIPNGYFCKNCSEVPAYITVKICPDCGLPLKYCACKWNFYYFDEIISSFEGDDATRNSFYSFKFRGDRSGGKFFSNEMSSRFKKNSAYLDVDVITSVPSHKSALYSRGYDQVKILAKNISKEVGIKYKPLLNQPKPSPKQHETKGISERFLNVENKYRVLKNVDIKDKTVLLVDDIKTTGATLSRCARELKLAGAEKVIAISALTIYPKKDETKKKEGNT